MKSLTLRMYLYFILGAFIASLFSIIMLSFDYKKNIHRNMEQSLLRGAIAAQTIIDPVQHNLLASNPAGRETLFYKDTLAKLEQIRDISNFAYIYTLVRNPDGGFFFIFDTEDYHVEPGEKISYHRRYDNMPQEVADAFYSRLATITESYYEDEWGIFKSAFHPVVNKNRGVEFIIGVDYDVSYIASLNRKVVVSFFVAMSAALPFILILIFFLKKDIIVHVNKLTEGILLSEKENLKLKNYLSNIIESMPAILVSTDSAGRIIEWNIAAETITGIKREFACGRKITEIIPYFEKYYSALSEVRESKVPKEFRRQRVDGDAEKFVDILIYPLIANGIEGSVIKIDDVSGIELQQQQLIQSQKMESLGILAGGIAHDFNNVLGGIIGAVSLLKLKVEGLSEYEDPDLKKYIKIVDDASLHGKALASQLLTLSRRNDSKTENIRLSGITEKVVDICRSTFESTVAIEYQSYDDNLHVCGDKGQLEQVIMNLCINGYQAMTLMRKSGLQNQSRLEITLSRFMPDEVFLRKYPSATGDYCRVSVSDTGVGIASEKIGKIFEPFYSTKSDSGTGLGLFIVATIVERHNGFIDVESVPEHGTTISVYLPAAETCCVAESLADKDRCAKKGGGLIIVADDEHLIRNTMKMLLEQCGFEVLQAADGEGALAYFESNIDRVKGILVDLVMPGMSGLEVALKIKKRKHDVVTVLVTGYLNKVVETDSSGAIDICLQKPFSFDDLVEALSEAGIFNE